MRVQDEPCIETYSTVESDAYYLDFATNCFQPCVEGHESDALWFNTYFHVTNPTDGHARVEAKVANPLYIKFVDTDDSLITLSQTGWRYLTLKNTSTVTWSITDDNSSDCFRGVIIEANASTGSGGGTTYTGSNLGSPGAGIADVFTAVVGNDFRFRRIKAGTNVSVTYDANYITISSSIVDTNDTYQFYNAGTGTGLVYKSMSTVGSVNSVYLRSIKQGQYIFVTNNDDDITISGYAVTGASDGSCVAIATPYNFYQGTTVDNTAHTVTLKFKNWGRANDLFVTECVGGGYILDVNAQGNNLGSGAGVYYNKSYSGTVTQLNMRSISAGAGISVDISGDDHEIIISSTVVDTNDTYSFVNVGTGTGQVWRDTTGAGSAHIVNLKTIKQGTGITVTNNANDITIACTITDTNDTYSAANVGTGTGHIWRDTTNSGSAHTFNYKTLKQGAGITITDGTDEITIACTITDTVMYYDMDNVGGQTVVYRDKSGTGTLLDPVVFHIKTLQAGTNVNFTGSTADKIVINSTDTNNTYLMANVGTGEGHVWRDTTGTNPQTFNLKTLKAGSGIFISDGTNEITVSCTVTDTNDTYAAANVGTGEGHVWRDTTHSGSLHTFNYKTIKQGAGIVVTDNADEILITCTVTDTVLYYDMANVGGQTTVYKNKTGSGTLGDPYVFNIKTLQAGSNIDFTGSTADKIVINSTYVNSTYAMANVGTGEGQVWRDTTGSFPSMFNLKTIKSGAFVYVTNNADDITINAWSVTGLAYGTCDTIAAPLNMFLDVDDNATTHVRTLRFRNFGRADDLFVTTCSGGTGTAYIFSVDVNGYNMGAGYEVYDGKYHTGTQTFLKLRTFLPGTGIELDYDLPGDNIVISCTVTDTTYTFSNVGTGAGVVKNTTGTNPVTVNFKSIKQGTGISITDGVDEITISCALTQRYYSIASDGAFHTLINSTTGSGTAGDPFVFHVKSLQQGAHMKITDETDNVLIDSDIFWTHSNVGTGEGVWAATTNTGTVADPFQVKFKSIKQGTNVTVSATSTEITISSLNNTYSFGNTGDGEHVLKSVTVTGSNTALVFKTIRAENSVCGITVDSDPLDRVIKISSSLVFKAATLTQTIVSTIEAIDNTYDIEWAADFTTAHEAKFKPIWAGYNTKWDTVRMIDRGTLMSEMVVPDNTWQVLYFTNEIIEDTPGWIYAHETDPDPWYFMPDDEVDYNWRVVVHLQYLGRNPVANTLPAVCKFPEIALFVNNTYWDTLCCDELVGAYGELRAYLMLSDSLLAASVPESGSKSYLQGSDLVNLKNNVDKLSVRFRHRTGSDVYIKLTKGSISISKLGKRNPLGPDPQEPPYNFPNI